MFKAENRMDTYILAAIVLITASLLTIEPILGVLAGLLLMAVYGTAKAAIDLYKAFFVNEDEK